VQKCRSAASASDQTGICTANVGTFHKKPAVFSLLSTKHNIEYVFPYMFVAEGIAKKAPDAVLTKKIIHMLFH
jgi:hypothetical protein